MAAVQVGKKIHSPTITNSILAMSVQLGINLYTNAQSLKKTKCSRDEFKMPPEQY